VSKGLREIIRVVRSNDRLVPVIQRGMAMGEPWWVDPENTELLEKVAHAMMRGDNDRSGSFHPSSLTSCKRRQVYEFFGVPPTSSWDPQLRTIFADGHWRHMRWQVILHNLGLIDDFEVPVSLADYGLTGSADGVKSDEYLVEIKGTSVIDQVRAEGVMPAHRVQVNAYLAMAGLDEAIVLYEAKSNSALVELTVHRDENLIGELLDVLADLMFHVEHETLPPIQEECRYRAGDFPNCPYRHVCLDPAAKDPEAATRLAADLSSRE
jgi:hypothetical protein